MYFERLTILPDISNYYKYLMLTARVIPMSRNRDRIVARFPSSKRSRYNMLNCGLVEQILKFHAQ